VGSIARSKGPPQCEAQRDQQQPVEREHGQARPSLYGLEIIVEKDGFLGEITLVRFVREFANGAQMKARG
jgi:hypothetical protein